MKRMLTVCCLLLASNFTKAQDVTFINNTNCKIWADFYCRAPNCGVAVNTGAIVLSSGTSTYNATSLNGGTPMPAGSAWLYGRVGDDNANCTLKPAGGGCGRNFYLTISDGTCTNGVTSGCYNADVSSTCNTCGNTQINVTTKYHSNGDLDVIFN